MRNRLRLAVMGAGLIGRRHIQTILALPEVAELVGIADPAGDRALAVGGAAWFGDAADMLARAKPEAAIIATPTGMHAAQGLLCSTRGIHFLVEKPVTATLGRS